MKADWVIRIELARFFDKHSELRGRTSVGLFKDEIYRGVFKTTLQNKFSAGEIQTAIKNEWLSPEKINVGGTLRHIYLSLQHPCIYQPSRYKRTIKRIVDWFISTRFFDTISRWKTQ